MANFSSKRLKRIRFQAILASLFFTLCVVSAGTATFAWFYVNRKVSADYQSIVTDSVKYIKNCEYYEIDHVTVNSDSTRTYSFKNTALTFGFAIGKYSRAFATEEHQILIKVTLNNTYSNFISTATAEADILGGGNSWSAVSWATTNNPLSSIAAFNTYASSQVTASGDYLVVSPSSDNPTTKYSFVSMSGDTPTYTQSFQIGDEFTTSSDSVIYFVIDYNLAAIDSIYSYNIGNEAFESETGITYKCDFAIRVMGMGA
jgi:hypothetical protein